MTTAATLETLMGRSYRAAVMAKEPLTKVRDDFATAAGSDPELRAAAQAELDRLTKPAHSAIEKRCIISKTRADFLRSVLSEG